MAATYGRSWPNDTASLMYGLNFSLFSMNCGANRVPSVNAVTSLARSITTKWSFGSMSPASPELQPAVLEGGGGGGLVFVIALENHRAVHQHLAVV